MKNLAKNNKNQGITLIALVVTIIVLLILAGVSLNLIAGSDGILSKATRAVNKNNTASLEEEINLKIVEEKMAYFEKNEEQKENKTEKEYLEEVLKAGIQTSKGTVVLDDEGNLKLGVEIIGDYDSVTGKITITEIAFKQEKEEDYIEKHIQVDKKIYISSEIGSDEAGDGTRTSPYKTLNKIAEAGIIENEKSYGIVLMAGEYELTEKIFELNCNQEINIIGDKEKTILKADRLYANNGGGSTNYSVRLYRLVWEISYAHANAIFLNTSLYLYNVAFNVNVSEENSFVFAFLIPGTNPGYELVNCCLPNKTGQFLRGTHGGIKLTNCYGGFSPGYGTYEESYNYQTNYLTGAPKVDTTTYRITDDESVWKNKGTGTNSDGTPANLGVYGGEFSWEE